MDADGVELPIFELPLVLLPGELLPLHIFEERYKRMIAHCVDDGEPFGIVFRDDEGGARRVGCEARVTEVTERFDDGRLNILVTGERPFRVLDRFDSADYPAGEVAPVEPGGTEGETGRSTPRARPERRSPSSSAGSAVRSRSAPSSRRPIRTGSPPGSSCRRRRSSSCSSCAPSRARMEVLAAALQALVRAVARSREIAERAKMNGKVIIADVED